MFFDLSWSHIILLLVVALVVVGPQDLPKIMRKAGQWTAKARAMADQFRNSFDEMARQTELDELRKEIESLRNARPLAETEQALSNAIKIPEISIAPPAAVAGAAAAGVATTQPSDAVSGGGSDVGTPAELPAPDENTLPPSAGGSAALVRRTPEPVFSPPPGEPAVAMAEPDKPLEGGITPPAP